MCPSNSSYFGAFVWKIGTSCCPCFGRSDESSGSWKAIAREFIKKMAPSSANEGQQLIKRTKSEEEILKKRPKRKIVAKKPNEEGLSTTDKDSDIVSVKSNTDSVDKIKLPTNHLPPSANGANTNRKIKPPPPPSRPTKDIESPTTNGPKNVTAVTNHKHLPTKDVDKNGSSSTLGPVTSSNGGARTRIRTESSKIMTEDKRSQSMSRIIPSSK